MKWQKLQDGMAKRFVLSDGAQVLGVVKASAGEAQIAFFADGDDVAGVAAQSEQLGGFSDFIDNLQPQDVIDICCKMDKTAKAS